MTSEQKKKCHIIIHSHATLAAAANAGVPIPGVGIVADLVTITSMTVQLALVFNQSMADQTAKGVTIAALKRYILKHPIKWIGKTLGKFIPFASSAVSVSIIEGTGWLIANDLDKKSRSHR